jgi:argininosuccinate lyase
MAETKNLWGGRFKGKADPEFVSFNNSFRFDRRLLAQDVTASVEYANALERAGVLNSAETAEIREALHKILERASSDENYLNSDSEDIHSFVESRLVDAIGDLGRKLHTGRSRNDQVATDFRLWVREAIDQINNAIKETQLGLVKFATSKIDVVIPGYTHLQPAQPILLAHWCLAYFEMLGRDRDRLVDCRRRVNVLPLGSAALAGNSFSIDREALAAALGFEDVSRNSLDGVSDRDFCLEFLSCCSLIMVHLSRLAEDIIIYSTNEFGFIQLGDAIATGSSLMPQKKNPDSMELVRGKAGRVFGELSGMLATMKGLPLAYNKDMQEDKEAVFDTFDTVMSCLKVTRTVLSNIDINRARASAAATQGYTNATELADYLVRKGMPFREAHEVVGRIVVAAIEQGQELQKLTLEELRQFSSLLEEDVFESLSLQSTLKTKSVLGGTAPERVAEALKRAGQSLA